MPPAVTNGSTPRATRRKAKKRRAGPPSLQPATTIRPHESIAIPVASSSAAEPPCHEPVSLPVPSKRSTKASLSPRLVKAGATVVMVEPVIRMFPEGSMVMSVTPVPLRSRGAEALHSGAPVAGSRAKTIGCEPPASRAPARIM